MEGPLSSGPLCYFEAFVFWEKFGVTLDKRDYYEVLGVGKTASTEEIKKAYRKLAVKHHPDKTQGDKASEEKFKEASEAYQVLSNDDTRARYDQYGHAGLGGAGGFDGYTDFSSFAEEIFGDIFGSFFGTSSRTRGGRRSTAGRDLREVLEITLEEAAFGTEKEITVSRPCSCEGCDGSGARKGTSKSSCRQCGGAGQIRIQQGFFAVSTTCPACGGRGVVIPDPCPSCGGTGQQVKKAQMNVKVPAGIDHGQRLKLRGEGGASPDGGPNGDLYVEIAVKAHKFFRREGTEIVCDIPIGYTQAVLGADIEVPSLHGKVTVKIPPGTPSGKVFRIKGKGIVDIHSGRQGDQHVRAFVYVPTAANDEHRELLEKLAKIEGQENINGSQSLFDKLKGQVKDLFD